MTPLKIINARPAHTWERMKRAPRALVTVEYRLNPCDLCVGTCCHFMVQLSAVEAVRIALTLAVPPAEVFTTMEWEPDTTTGQRSYHPIKLDDGRVSLLIKRDPESRACAFKLDLGPLGRCGIYTLRPGQCRMFPLHVEEPDGHQIRVGVDDYCPTAWLYDEGTEERFTEHVANWREDVARDKELCARWNRGRRKDRSIAAFFRWACFELAPAFRLDAEVLYPPERRSLKRKPRG